MTEVANEFKDYKESKNEQTEPLLDTENMAIDIGEMEVSGEMDKTEIPQSTSSIFSLLNITNSFHAPAFGAWLLSRRETMRPWSQFLNTASFSTPSNVRMVSGRLIKNLLHFQSNYFIVFLLLIAYCLITSPLLLLVIVGSLYGGNRVLKRHEEHKFSVMGRELTKKEIYLCIVACTIPLFYLVGVGSVVFWALGASFFLIGLHATFYSTETRDLSEEHFGLMEDV